MRSEADADRAIALHRRLGYDLVKVYSRLTPPVFDRLAEGARRAGLPIAGHVPWSVALDHAVNAGMRSIEHMTGVVAALQAADSPVAGRSDGPWRDRDIDHVDESPSRGSRSGAARTEPAAPAARQARPGSTRSRRHGARDPS